MLLILGCGFALISLLLVTIQKTYYHVPRYELKRRARNADRKAQILYHAVAYDTSLHTMLWLLIGVSAATAFVLLARSLPFGVALGVVAVLTWWNFVWLPGSRITKWSVSITVWVTPPIAWLASHVHPIFVHIQSLLPKAHINQSDIFEVEDLLAVIENQKNHVDGRIDAKELDSAQRVLTFGHKLVRDIVLPRSQLKLLSADDSIGPILLSELHRNGQDNFVVYKDKPENIVGLLSLAQAISASGGRVGDIMQSQIKYINEAQPLKEVLQAFHSSNANIFLVVNNFDEFVGTVTVGQVLYEALGEAIADGFEAYDSRSVAANYQPATVSVEELEMPEQTEKPQDSDSENSPPNPPEVIE